MSRLLIREPPLQVLPSLAEKIGLNESIVLQQVHYWIGNPKVGKMHDGRRWVRNSFDDWQESNFPFWSVRTLKRVMANLVDQGLILVDNLNQKTYDRTLWYTVDYDALDKLALAIVTDCHYGSDKLSLSEGQVVTHDSDNVAPPIPETLSENEEENDGDAHARAEEVALDLLDYWQDLTGSFAPTDDGKRALDYVGPLNRLWIRVNRDPDMAKRLLREKREEMLSQGKTPYRPAAIVPAIFAELDGVQPRASPNGHGKAPEPAGFAAIREFLEDMDE